MLKIKSAWCIAELNSILNDCKTPSLFFRFVYRRVSLMPSIFVLVTFKLLFFHRHLIPKPLLIVLLSELCFFFVRGKKRKNKTFKYIRFSRARNESSDLLIQLLNAWKYFWYLLNQSSFRFKSHHSVEWIYWTNMIYVWRSTSTLFNRAMCMNFNRFLWFFLDASWD